MVTYTCDRCSAQLTSREDVRGGAHRITVTDVIPWTPGASHGARKLPTVDLCGACFGELELWITGSVIPVTPVSDGAR